MTTPFPQRQWGSPESPLARAADRFAGTKFGSRVVRALTPLDRRVLERTDARYTVLGPIGAPVILLTTTGRRSGQPRTQPLLCVHDGATLYVIGSNFGGARHPAWTANLLAEPRATVSIAGERVPVIATRVEGAAAESVFERFVEITGAYAVYRKRTDRDLRIFALSRV
ncbi:nitroreductase/quinone reductase family protein [Nocardia sp. NPDC050193]